LRGELYAIGGQAESGLLAQTLRYRRDAYSWSPLADKPSAASHLRAGVMQGRIVVPGGCGADGNALEAVESYEPDTDTWTVLAAELPAPVCDYALAAHEGSLYLFGGRAAPGAATATRAVWRLRPEATSWEPQPDMPGERAALSAVTLSDGIHLLGGQDRSGAATQDHWLFDPDLPSRPWRFGQPSLPSLPEPRAAFAAVGVLGGIWIIGGGLDRPLDAIVWDGRGSTWSHEPAVLPNPEGPPSPQRGVGIAFEGGKTVVVAGGESAAGRLLDLHLAYIRRFETIFVPARGR
jgi:hypothetical protein